MLSENHKTINQHFFPESYSINYKNFDKSRGVPMGLLKSPLMEAVCENDIKKAYQYIKGLEKQGIMEHSDPTMCDETPLVEAVFRHHNEMASFLLQMGAQPNNRAKGYFSPLEAAICADNHEMIDILLPVADLTCVNRDGDHPLMFACLKGNLVAACEILRTNPQVVNLCNKKGISPLMLAASRGHEDVVRVLVGYNARADVLHDGKTAADYAKLNGYLKLASKLRTVSIGRHFDPFRLKQSTLAKTRERD